MKLIEFDPFPSLTPDPRAARCELMTRVAVADWGLHQPGPDAAYYKLRLDNFDAYMSDSIRHVLWTFGDAENGVVPGDFTQALIKAVQLADPENLGRLARSFPGLVTLVRVAQELEGGLDVMRRALEPADLT